MHVRQKRWIMKPRMTVLFLCLFLCSLLTALPVEAGSDRKIVVAGTSDDYEGLKARFVSEGATVVKEMRQILSFVVVAPTELIVKSVPLTSLKAKGIYSLGKDRPRSFVRPSLKTEMFGSAASGSLPLATRTPIISAAFHPDPAYSVRDLLWNYPRISVNRAWAKTSGSSAVSVGVADTGLDYTHADLQGKVLDIVDLTDTTLCKDYFGYSDADWAAEIGGPADTDWNGHGTWIGGTIAGLLDGYGTNGLAPGVGLVALKISEWCGYAYDSSIIGAITTAADMGIDVVNISFGGYTDRSDPEEEVAYQQYVAAVAYAKSRGTVVVSSAGNDHVRIDANGMVASHGSLTLPGDEVSDFYGLYETPAGVPGILMVSATGNVVERATRNCKAGTYEDSTATCKPSSDLHQPIGAGRKDQLAYYSNFGPRIDLGAPGGARKFNLPSADRGGTPGWPVTDANGTKAWEEFGVTSNWALEIPCYWIDATTFKAEQCYTTIQGTSMASPHVAAVAALVAGYNTSARKNPDKLIALLKKGARRVIGNKTPPLSATDTSAGDLTGLPCLTGYCHLGGSPIPDAEAYGAGLLDAFKAITAK
jgi:lantibiotic leader peptide-processing serine protease